MEEGPEGLQGPIELHFEHEDPTTRSRLILTINDATLNDPQYTDEIIRSIFSHAMKGEQDRKVRSLNTRVQNGILGRIYRSGLSARQVLNLEDEILLSHNFKKESLRVFTGVKQWFQNAQGLNQQYSTNQGSSPSAP